MKYQELTLSQFLNYLPKENRIYFSADPNPKSKDKKAHMSFDEKYLRGRNSLGKEIYFSVNQFSNGARQEKYLKKICACYLDFDVAKEGGNKSQDEVEDLKSQGFDNLVKMHLPPHIVIISKNGLQPIWLIDENRTDDNIKKFYKSIEMGLIDYSKTMGNIGDEVKDISRVLRLPTFNHVKDKNNPYLIKALLIHTSEPYKLENLAQQYFRFPRDIEPTSINENDYPINKIPITNIAIEVMKKMKYPQAQIMPDGRLSAEIDENGSPVPTGGFIGKLGSRDYIGSTSSWFQGGNRVTVVSKNLNISNKEAYHWICNKFNIPTSSEDILVKTNTHIPPRQKISFNKNSNSSGLKLTLGYKGIDTVTQGLSAGVYQIAAPQKIGKSALVMNFINHWLNNGLEVTVFDSELGQDRYLKRLTAIETGNYWKIITRNTIQAYLENRKLNYYSNEEEPGKLFFMDETGFSVERLLQAIRQEAIAGVKIIVVDNITNFANSNSIKSPHEIISTLISSLVVLHKEYGLHIFIVNHSKKGVLEKPISKRLFDAIKKGDPKIAFSESTPVYTVPILDDCYGGAGLNLLFGSFLLWRPFAEYTDEKYSQVSKLFLAGSRDSNPTEIILDFLGEKMMFIETE